MTTPQPIPTTSGDILADRLDQLRALIPEAFSEGRVDWDKLRAALGDWVDTASERYSFSWAGKRDAIRLLQTPTRATLIPCPDESINWDETQHLFIEGDNLEVLKLLYKPYFGRVKMIYIDPPYNTGNDFVYPDDYADPLGRYLDLTGQRDAEGNLLTSNPETSGRYHSAWLSMMYPRLFIARQLLREDGVILVSIDDTEVANLKLVLNELFGEENFVAHILWQKRYVSNVTAKWLSDMHDHILVYARDKEKVVVNKLPRTEEQLEAYQNPDNDPRGPWRPQDLSASKPYSAGLFSIITPANIEVNPPPGRYWRCNEEQYNKWLSDNRIWFGQNGTGRPMLKAFLSESQKGVTPNTWWDYAFAGHNKEATLEIKDLFDGMSPFDTAKPVKLLSRMLELFADPDSLILDFFAGSCTTAHAVLEYNHENSGFQKFILVQLPESLSQRQEIEKNAISLGLNTIAEIGKERIRRVIRQMQSGSAENGQLALDLPTDQDLGFKVFKLAPSHIRPWRGVQDATPEAYAEQMALFSDPLVEGWTVSGLAYEIALKEGYGLNCTIDPLPAPGIPAIPPPRAGEGLRVGAFYRITDPDKAQSFTLCLADEIPPDIIAALGLSQDDLFICRDAALTDDLAANLALQCRLKTI